jgi:O-antigen/teichoic acid export membrane protein
MISAEGPSKGRQVANSTGLRAAAEVVALVTAMASSVVLARRIGPAAMGAFALAVLIGQIAVSISDLGIAQTLQVSVARGAVPVRVAVLRTLAVRVGAALGIALVLACLTLLVVPATADPLRPLILLVLIGSPLNALGQTWAFLATGRVAVVSGLRIIGPLLGLASIALLVRGPADTVPMAMLFLSPLAVAAAAGAVFAGWLALRTTEQPGPTASLRDLLGGAGHFLVSGITIFFSLNADRLILGILASPLTLGLYDAANRMVAPFWSVAGVVTDAHYRRVADADAGGDAREAKSVYRRVAMLLLLPTLPLGLGATMFGRELLDLLFGAEFVGAYPYFAGIAWTMTLAYIVACYTVPLPPWRETAAVARVGVAGAITSVVAGVPLIALLGGGGAVLSRAAVQVALSVPAYPVRRRYVNALLGQALRSLVPAVALSGLAGWAVSAATGAWTLAMVAFCAVYAVGAVAGLRSMRPIGAS